MGGVQKEIDKVLMVVICSYIDGSVNEVVGLGKEK